VKRKKDAGMNWKWLKRLVKKFRGKTAERKIPWPTPEEMAVYPWFEELRLDQIVVVSTPEAARRAHDELIHAQVVGFDTESKPTFVKGEVSQGPHVAQFATLTRAYVFMLHQLDCRKAASQLIKSSALKKVGFGLSDDLKRIRLKLKIQPRAVLDLETLFAAKGYGRGVGVKIGVAVVFHRRFRKSRRTSTSNWGASQLTNQQVLYAANDAYAAIKVFRAF
jgi:hypothetical protein